MPTQPHRPDPESLARLTRIATTLSVPATADSLATVLRFTALARERIGVARFERPWLMAVIEGQKRLRIDGRQVTVDPGVVAVVPSGFEIDIENVTSPTTGRYLALCMEILADASAMVSARAPELAVPGNVGGFDPSRVHLIAADRGALDALAHFCEGVVAGSVHPTLLTHRLEGALLALLLVHRGAATLSALAPADVLLALRSLVRRDLSKRWTAPSIARALGTSEATLRRRLAEHRTSLRRVLAEERMSLARTLLADGRHTVAEVARRCGYESASRFARQFERAWGQGPSRLRGTAPPLRDSGAPATAGRA